MDWKDRCLVVSAPEMEEKDELDEDVVFGELRIPLHPLRHRQRQNHPSSHGDNKRDDGAVVEKGEKGRDATNAKTIDLINCGHRCRDLRIGDLFGSTEASKKADRWFSRVLGRVCRLVRVPQDHSTPLRGAGAENIGFSNEKQLLLINMASVENLQQRLTSFRASTKVVAPMVTHLSFRPNVVVSRLPAFEENGWASGKRVHMSFGGRRLGDTGGLAEMSNPCIRCSMINRDPHTGKVIPDVLQVLSTYQKSGSAVRFGRYLSVVSSVEQDDASGRAGARVKREFVVGSSLVLAS